MLTGKLRQLSGSFYEEKTWNIFDPKISQQNYKYKSSIIFLFQVKSKKEYTLKWAQKPPTSRKSALFDSSDWFDVRSMLH